MAVTVIPDEHVANVQARGYTVVPDSVTGEDLRAAQEALWLHHPRPEEYFADPSAFPNLQGSQLAGPAVSSTRPALGRADPARRRHPVPGMDMTPYRDAR